jgi:hypothetical protein
VLSAEAQDLDLILIPGVAFDADCNRVRPESLLQTIKSMIEA